MNGNINDNHYNIRQELKDDIWLIIIIIATFISAVSFYGKLPNVIPVHWGINGNIDGYGSKNTIFLMPVLNIVIYAILLAIPIIDPKRGNYGKFKNAYRVIRSVIIIFFTVVYAAILTASLGYKVRVDFIITLSISILFIVIGSFMDKIKHNYFVGIRTPWTLANEDVWTKTHRLGGRLFVAAGIISMIGSFIGGFWSFALMMASVLIAALIPAVYSFVIYKNSHGT